MTSKSLLLGITLWLSSFQVGRADTVLLANCPEEPDVIGTFYNNGSKCVRDAQTIGRETIDATCPEGFTFGKNGYCRHGANKPVKPSCPENYQRYGNQCQLKCPKGYKSKYSECSLPRATLSTNYMSCPDPATQHRYDAYCCTPGSGNCPDIQCKVGDNVPGTFFYNPETSMCQRQSTSLARKTFARRRKKGKPTNIKESPCDDGMNLVWGTCQEPCPQGYRPLKGKCELRACTFDATTDTTLTCPEGSYPLPQSLW